jgi:hypothetical protein
MADDRQRRTMNFKVSMDDLRENMRKLTDKPKERNDEFECASVSAKSLSSTSSSFVQYRREMPSAPYTATIGMNSDHTKLQEENARLKEELRVVNDSIAKQNSTMAGLAQKVTNFANVTDPIAKFMKSVKPEDLKQEANVKRLIELAREVEKLYA